MNLRDLKRLHIAEFSLLFSLTILILDSFSYLGVKVPQTVLRITYSVLITSIFGSKSLDVLIASSATALTSLLLKHKPSLILIIASLFALSIFPQKPVLPLITTFLASLLLMKNMLGKNVRSKPYDLLVYACFVIGFPAVVYWGSIMVFPYVGAYLRPFGVIESYIMGLLASISAAAYLVLLYYTLYLLYLFFKGKAKENLVKFAKKPPRDNVNYRKLLLAGIVLAAIIPLIPYIPTLNPKQIPVNADWLQYYSCLIEVDDLGISAAFNVMNGSRPLYVLMLYCVCKITGLSFDFVSIYHNVVLLPLYALSLWFLAKSLFNSRVASYVMLVTPLTPTYMGFILGGFQANLFSLILMNIGLGLFFRAKGNIKSLPAVLTLFIMADQCHPWAWLQYVASLLILSIISIIKFKNYRNLHMLLALLAIYKLFYEIIRGFPTLNFVYISSTYNPRLYSKWGFIDLSDIYFITAIYLWGVLNQPLYPMLTLLSLGEYRELFPLAMLSATAIALPFISPVFFIRLILNIPLPILFAHKLMLLKNNEKMAVVLLLLAYTLRTLITTIPNPQLQPYLHIQV